MTRNAQLFLLYCALALLVACSSASAAEPSPSPVAPQEPQATEPRSSGGAVAASAEVVPASKAEMSFTVSGRLDDCLVDVGDAVRPGEALMVLANESLEAEVARAEAALAAAEAQFDRAAAGATPEEIAAVEAAVATAEGQVKAAEAASAQARLRAGQAVETAEATLAQAQGAVEIAKAEMARSYAVLAQLQEGSRPEEIAYYQALLAQAEAQLRYPTNVHDQIIDWGLGGPPEEQARFQMEAAQSARDAASAKLALAQAGAPANQVNAAGAGVRVAQGQVTVAEAGVQIAEAALAEAQTGETDVAVAEAQLQIAQGQLVQAQAERDQLLAGVTAGELAMLAAQVDQAAAALELAEAALAESTLVAPFAGTVAALESSPGETVMPGQVVLTLADLDRLRVETNDLSERDVDQVVVGAPALVYVEALGTTVQGEVVGIEPRSSTIGGDVVYRVVVALEEAPPDLRWGMSADVEISTD